MIRLSVFILALTTTMTTARAEEIPPPNPLPHQMRDELANLDLDIRGQGQFIFLASIPAADGGIAGGELQLNGSIYGIGLAWGILIEDQDTGDGDFFGVSSHIGLQYRFVAQLSRYVYPYFDPHIDLGFLLGGGDLRDEARFRGAVYVGGGIDVPLQFAKLPQVVASVQYRFMAAQAPDDLEAHLVVVGLGIRIVSDPPIEPVRPPPEDGRLERLPAPLAD